ncbi:hypothetical protein [Mesorhizobium sp. YR577]|jgi:hypothetical protein|uniref:hypothetical protein n=1 Tax=Mesorhizobium sp. YR577 TaxID=1884373 RepID=UPI0008E8D88D|nr:hypothetical protein [Mesorhizobium sp. YR577]SFU09952.1 hypothetical protein SAMN05518861_112193 [Mesorhizobium sp. YR577]
MTGIAAIGCRIAVIVSAYMAASLCLGVTLAIISWIIDSMRGVPTWTLGESINTTTMIAVIWAVLLLVFTLPPILWAEWRRVTNWRYFASAGISLWAIFFGLVVLDQLGIEPLPDLLFFGLSLLPSFMVGSLVYWWLTVKAVSLGFRPQTS